MRQFYLFLSAVLLSSITFASDCPDNVPCTVELPGSFCGDGTQSFVRITHRKDAKGLAIYLNGGGACWDKASCGCKDNGKCDGGTASAGLTRIKPESMGNWSTGSGWRNASDPANPLAQGYSVIEMPYCTGDVYSGSRNVDYGKGGNPIIVRHQGHENVRLMLEEAAKRFPNPDKLVFMGCSAGGLGVTFNVHQVNQTYPHVPTYVVSDSGLPFKAPHVHQKDIERVLKAWGSETLIPGIDPGADGVPDFGDVLRHNGTKFPQVKYALFSAYNDTVMTFFALKVGSPYPTQAVAKIMNDTADNDMVARDAQKVFYLAGSKHCFHDKSPAEVKSDGVKLSDFMAAMIGNDPHWESVRPK